MEKILRLAHEAWFALCTYQNAWVYFFERFGWLRDKKIVLRFWNGIRYAVNTNTTDPRAVNEIWNTKVYDRFLSRLQNGGVVIDIGANIGVFSVKVAKVSPSVRVYAYEPLPANFAVLEENVRQNGLEERVKPWKLAVSDHRGSASLYWDDRNRGGGTLLPDLEGHGAKSLQVECITLEDVFRANNILECEYLKIDCEGTEVPLLMNAPREIFSRIKTITLEWHHGKMSIEEFLSFLNEAGYSTDFDARTSVIYAERK
ncbi:MAG: FkbM family methyltransferase [Candidatus Liptonbacteria bacterium]|nr:FkbM family methyltransferase [Candidatus Liptonbacteria bacterium]